MFCLWNKKSFGNFFSRVMKYIEWYLQFSYSMMEWMYRE